MDWQILYEVRQKEMMKAVISDGWITENTGHDCRPV